MHMAKKENPSRLVSTPEPACQDHPASLHSCRRSSLGQGARRTRDPFEGIFIASPLLALTVKHPSVLPTPIANTLAADQPSWPPYGLFVCHTTTPTLFTSPCSKTLKMQTFSKANCWQQIQTLIMPFWMQPWCVLSCRLLFNPSRPCADLPLQSPNQGHLPLDWVVLDWETASLQPSYDAGTPTNAFMLHVTLASSYHPTIIIASPGSLWLSGAITSPQSINRTDYAIFSPILPYPSITPIPSLTPSHMPSTNHQPPTPFPRSKLSIHSSRLISSTTVPASA
ncbi:hypothetical protein IAQ61_010738 [Plenodomus lingam]|uniref:uncharacterized protein n=1 Tax=Leptosphaeria maculans TaxID=5022 RepID=UPI0033233AC5|nr:hypothetical protein IAQ61_010738 [Plenodomus lingam]